MKKRWETQRVEVYFDANNEETELRILEEVGGILYSYYCQLSRGFPLTETTVAASKLERTRTDG
jgi:hypothetical protein